MGKEAGSAVAFYSAGKSYRARASGGSSSMFGAIGAIPSTEALTFESSQEGEVMSVSSEPRLRQQEAGGGNPPKAELLESFCIADLLKDSAAPHRSILLSTDFTNLSKPFMPDASVSSSMHQIIVETERSRSDNLLPQVPTYKILPSRTWSDNLQPQAPLSQILLSRTPYSQILPSRTWSDNLHPQAPSSQILLSQTPCSLRSSCVSNILLVRSSSTQAAVHHPGCPFHVSLQCLGSPYPNIFLSQAPPSSQILSSQASQSISAQAPPSSRILSSQDTPSSRILSAQDTPTSRILSAQAPPTSHSLSAQASHHMPNIAPYRFSSPCSGMPYPTPLGAPYPTPNGASYRLSSGAPYPTPNGASYPTFSYAQHTVPIPKQASIAEAIISQALFVGAQPYPMPNSALYPTPNGASSPTSSYAQHTVPIPKQASIDEAIISQALFVGAQPYPVPNSALYPTPNSTSSPTSSYAQHTVPIPKQASIAEAIISQALFVGERPYPVPNSALYLTPNGAAHTAPIPIQTSIALSSGAPYPVPSSALYPTPNGAAHTAPIPIQTSIALSSGAPFRVPNLNRRWDGMPIHNLSINMQASMSQPSARASPLVSPKCTCFTLGVESNPLGVNSTGGNSTLSVAPMLNDLTYLDFATAGQAVYSGDRMRSAATQSQAEAEFSTQQSGSPKSNWKATMKAALSSEAVPSVAAKPRTRSFHSPISTFIISPLSTRTIFLQFHLNLTLSLAQAKVSEAVPSLAAKGGDELQGPGSFPPQPTTTGGKIPAPRVANLQAKAPVLSFRQRQLCKT
eukprot:gene4219-14333_t